VIPSFGGEGKRTSGNRDVYIDIYTLFYIFICLVSAEGIGFPWLLEVEVGK
jgi:hypothetical protein